MNPKVSILIPAYNCEQYIKSTIESAIEQTYSNKEIIIINDGSTDNSYNIAKEFESETVKIYSQVNSGAASARNLAFQKSTGDYIQYLDGDDILAPEKLQKQMQALQKINFDSEYLSSCPYFSFKNEISDHKVKYRKLWEEENPIDWLIKSFEGGGMFQTACWLTPRKLIENVAPWNTTYRISPNDDGEFFTRILCKAKKIIYVNDAYVFYRQPSINNLSKQRSLVATKGLLHSLISNEFYIRKHEDSFRTRHALMKNYMFFIITSYPNYPNYIKLVDWRIKKMGFNRYPVYGPTRFKILRLFMGFWTALKFRQFYYKLGNKMYF